jgi:hypothetical protein
MPALVSMLTALLTAVAQLVPVIPHPWTLSPLLTGQDVPLALRFAILAGAAFAGLVFFRHDWAAMVSGFLQVILLRRRPLSLDERHPFLLAIAIGGAVGLAHLVHSFEPLESLLQAQLPLTLGIGLILGALVLWNVDSNGKTIKSMTGWTVVDAILCGILGGLALAVDGTIALGILVVARGRSFYREAAVKFLSLCAITLSFVEIAQLKRGLDWALLLPGSETAPLQWGLSFLVAFVATWAILNSYARRTEPTAFRRLAVLRALAGVALIAWGLLAMRGAS